MLVKSIIISAVGRPQLDINLMDLQLPQLEAAFIHREPSDLTRPSVHIIGGHSSKYLNE